MDKSRTLFRTFDWKKLTEKITMIPDCTDMLREVFTYEPYRCMSRSKKKNPISWLCNGKSYTMKQWKNNNDRSLRAKTDEIAPGSYYKKMNGGRANIWNSPSDGKASNEWRYENSPWKRHMK